MAEENALSAAEAVLLAVCAAPDAHHGSRFASLRTEEWAQLIDLGREQRALPLLRRAIMHAGMLSSVPPSHAVQLETAAWEQAQIVLQQRATLSEALEILGGKGLAPVALKGARLAWQDYPEPVLRPLRDLDLLLLPEQAERAQAMLLASGNFATLEEARPYGVEHGHQLPELVHRRHGVIVEIHHRLNARGWPEEAGLVDLMHSSAAELNLGGGLSVRVPSAHANVLHLVEHATLHHLFDNGPLIFADLHFAARSVDWQRLVEEASALGLYRALGLVSALAARHGADWVPPELVRPDSHPTHLRLAEAALLRSDADRKAIARLRRLEQRTGVRPGLAAGLRAAVRPDPSALAGIARTSPASPRRWLGYPAWLARRLMGYWREADGETRSRAASQVGLHAWLHGK